jgi:hypothetical protein
LERVVTSAPPPPVQLLLSWLERGHAIPLYNSA